MVAAPDEFLGLIARRCHNLAPVTGIRLAADEAALFQPVNQRRSRRRREICLPRYDVCRPRAVTDRAETAALGSAQHIDFGNGPIERFNGILPARHREAYRVDQFLFCRSWLRFEI
ncbi:hypothetical protein NKI53_00590 [Mesorhizobium sp. M0586]